MVNDTASLVADRLDMDDARHRPPCRRPLFAILSRCLCDQQPPHARRTLLLPRRLVRRAQKLSRIFVAHRLDCFHRSASYQLLGRMALTLGPEAARDCLPIRQTRITKILSVLQLVSRRPPPLN